MKRRIKDLRIEKGLTLKEVGDAIGVSESAAQRYETGNISNLKYDTVVALANLFGCEPTYLLGWDLDDDGVDHAPSILPVYNKLNAEGQAKVMEYARLLVSSGEYKR